MIDVDLVKRLIASQLPQWSDLSVTPVEVDGWDNRTYRLGDELVIAWTMFDGESRDAFRGAVGRDDATWARGWVLWKALIGLADDIDTDKERAAVNHRVIDEVLADHDRVG